MNPTSPGAYGLSALMHGAVVALVLFFSYAATSVVKENPKVFELVAGQGENYAARAAPALGSPGGLKLQATPAPRTESPRRPKAESPIQAAPEKAPAPAKPVDLVAELKRVEARRERRLEANYKKEKEAEEKRITQEEFLKEQAAAKAGNRVSHVDAEGIRAGVVGGSAENTSGGAGGKALTREEGSELEAYFSLLKDRVQENLTPPEGVSDSLAARIEFFLSADGSISQIRVVKSSGNHEFDRAAIEACERTRSIGPRPDGRSETVDITCHVKVDESP